jgi:predicted ATP-grasp superfamily ATP-dependent carboligase
VRVTVADGRPLAVARWSRHVRRRLACPDVDEEPERFVEWLLRFGAREPGTILYPTSDDMCWLLARHRGDLSRHFGLWMPDVDVLYSLLNKRRLYDACTRLGIARPATWAPRSAADVERIAREARFPVVVKPQTQVMLRPHAKGRFVGSAAELPAAYREFVRATSYGRLLRDWDPEVTQPLVQTFEGRQAEGVYNLSGFVDETGRAFVTAASRKVLQWPPVLGVGLCFEEAEVVPELADDVARLCADRGYFGAFEVEFVVADGRHLLIDFNPRFYGQMGFDIARGLDLPWLVYLAAVGDGEALRAAVGDARRHASVRGAHVYCDRVELELAQGVLRLAGRGPGDREKWGRWLSAHREGRVDAVLDPRDWMPGVAEALGALLRRARHPRSEWRSARRG